MKRPVIKMCVVALATGVIALGSASIARADETLATTVRVPFAFIVGDVRLPAGNYVVKDISAGGQVLEIVSADGRHVVFTATIPETELTQPPKPELVFEKFKGVYFLSRVVPADGNDREIVLTPALMEREIMRSGDHAAN